jgi:hypothetical protein
VLILVIPYIIFPIYVRSDINLQNIDITLQFNKYNAYNFVDDQLNLGNRIPGTQARLDCANYFISEFQKIDPGFSYYLHNYSILGTDCQNVLFKLNEQKKNIVILAAHYDSRAKATKNLPSSPVPGANDGASGSAVLIELAKIFYDNRSNLELQIWFLFFDAEDQGNDGYGYGILDWGFCEGSQKFVQDINNYYDSGSESFDAMILLDMVGGSSLQFINELNSRSSLLDELFIIGRALGYTSAFPENPTSMAVTDDHVAFEQFGIPTADLIINFWNNPSWPYHHTTQDDITHISRDSLEITGKTVEQFIFNNYYIFSKYRRNYPWGEDVNPFPIEIIIFFFSFLAIIAFSVIIIYFVRQNALEKARGLENLKQ